MSIHRKNYEDESTEPIQNRILYKITSFTDKMDLTQRLKVKSKDKDKVIGYMEDKDWSVRRFDCLFRKRTDTDGKPVVMGFCNHLKLEDYPEPIDYLFNHELQGLCEDSLYYGIDDTLTCITECYVSKKTPYKFQPGQRLIAYPEFDLGDKDYQTAELKNYRKWKNSNSKVGFIWIPYEKYLEIYDEYIKDKFQIKNNIITKVKNILPDNHMEENDYEKIIKDIHKDLKSAMHENGTDYDSVFKKRINGYLYEYFKSLKFAYINDIQVYNKFMVWFETNNPILKVGEEFGYDCRVVYQEENSILIKFSK